MGEKIYVRYERQHDDNETRYKIGNWMSTGLIGLGLVGLVVGEIMNIKNIDIPSTFTFAWGVGYKMGQSDTKWIFHERTLKKGHKLEFEDDEGKFVL